MKSLIKLFAQVCISFCLIAIFEIHQKEENVFLNLSKFYDRENLKQTFYSNSKLFLFPSE